MTYGDRLLLGSQRESQISKFRAWVFFAVPPGGYSFPGQRQMDR
jgi:hypothetical protein